MATIFQGVDHQVFSPSERLFEGLSPSPVETKLRTVEDSNPRADQSCNLLDEQSTRRVSAAKFVVFSGGKLEWRKGQDLVLAAFRNLLQRNPRLRGAAGAILVTAWVDPTNLRNGMYKTFEGSSHVKGSPATGTPADVSVWAKDNGVPWENMLHFDYLTHPQLASLLEVCSKHWYDTPLIVKD